MEVTTATRRRLRLTQHAVRRYRERVKPALDLKVCEDELWALTNSGDFLADEPFPRYGIEVAEMDQLPPPDGYIELAPRIYAVVEMEGDCFVILTVLVDGGLSPAARRKRNEGKAIGRRKKARRRREGFMRNGVRLTREARWK